MIAALSNHPGSLVRWAAGAVYVFCGFALIVLGLPIAALPFYRGGPEYWISWTSMAMPVWLGLVSAPGCFVAAILVVRQKQIRSSWVRISLWGSLIAASSGTAGGSLMALFIPFGLVGLIGSVVLLYAADGVGRRSEPEVRRWSLQIMCTVVAIFSVTLWALHSRPRE